MDRNDPKFRLGAEADAIAALAFRLPDEVFRQAWGPTLGITQRVGKMREPRFDQFGKGCRFLAMSTGGLVKH